MKHTILSCLFLAFIAIGCDNDKLEEPTTFQGEVIFPESYEVGDKRVVVTIVGFKSKGIGTLHDGVTKDSMDLDSENRFEITFPALEVDDFALGIDVINSRGTFIESYGPNELDCSPYDASSFQPGKEYDLTVRIIE